MASSVRPPAKAPRRLKVKAGLKRAVGAVPSTLVAQRREQLQAAVEAILTGAPVAGSFEALYQAVQDLCVHRHAEALLQGLREQLDRNVGARVRRLTEAVPEPHAYLQLVHREWQLFCGQLSKIGAIFLYLDRSAVVQASLAGSLFNVGLEVMQGHFQAQRVATRNLVGGILSMVKAERQGENTDRSLLGSVAHMLHCLQLYSSELEGKVLAETRAFYAAASQGLVAQMDASAYMVYCEQKLEEEAGRCAAYLQPETLGPLIEGVEAELLARAHVDQSFVRGFAGLMEGQKHADLKRMHTLLGRVGLLPYLQEVLQTYVRDKVGACVQDPEQDKTMIGSLLALKGRADEAVAAAFGGRAEFAKAVRDAFEAGINARQNKPAELLAKYVDGKMRGGNKGQQEDDLEREFDQLIVLFRYIVGKDVFEAFYQKDLAKRLLLGRSTSFDAEKNMIAKLKTECGAQFTSKLELMFKDIHLSQDLMKSFKASAPHQDQLAGGLEISVTVLTSGQWPTYPQMPLTLPAFMQRHQEVFKDFYLGEHNGRKLQWHNGLGQCVLRCEFAKGKKELVTSLNQAVVLLQFQGADRASVRDLAQATGIEGKELLRTLVSLSARKFQILKREGEGDKLTLDDTMVFNAGFKDKLYRIKVNTLQLKETAEEQQITTDKVMQDRQYQVDAAIVRIMKTRKALSHVLLMNELVQQLKFAVRPADLKKRIESLIEREYLERDGANASLYHYVA